MLPNLEFPALFAPLGQLTVEAGRHILLALADEQSYRHFDHLDAVKGCLAYLGIKDRHRRFGLAQKLNQLVLFLWFSSFLFFYRYNAAKKSLLPRANC